MTGIDHTQRAHSEHGASSAKQWMNCPGSIAAQRPFPNRSGPDADLGTAAHELAETALLENKCPTKYLGRVFNVNGKDFIVDSEMASNVRIYCDMIREDQERFGGELVVERRFNLSKHVHDGMFGTNDAALIYCTDGVLRVYDYKNGAGVYVDPVDNAQGKYYGLGAILDMDLKGVREIEIVIVQPRHREWSPENCRWRIDLIDLLDFAIDLREAVIATLAPDAPRTPGEWCTFCRARGVCPELREQAANDAMAEFANDGSLAVEPPAPLELSPDVAGQLLKSAALLEGWISGLRKYCRDVMDNGGNITGWKLVNTRATRKFADVDEARRHLLGNLDLDEDEIFTERKLLSVAQIEKLLGKKQFSEELGDMVTKSCGVTIAPLSDRRPALEASAVADFSDDDDVDFDD